MKTIKTVKKSVKPTLKKTVKADTKKVKKPVQNIESNVIEMSDDELFIVDLSAKELRSFYGGLVKMYVKLYIRTFFKK